MVGYIGSTMRITEDLNYDDLHPFSNDSQRDIEALQCNEYQCPQSVRQSSYDAYRAIVEVRRRAVRARARPWYRRSIVK